MACQRIYGKHTFELVASTLEGIHAKYQIANKVALTVTDNGSNFEKAFKEYSDAEATSNGGTSQTTLVHNNDGEILFTNISEILENEITENLHSLPPHHRCGAHTMNLIAVHDGETACNDADYKKISRAALAKCSSLWNKSSRSAQAAEIVSEKAQMALIVPNATRWNSYYLAVAKIFSVVQVKKSVVNNAAIVDYNSSTLNAICQQLNLPVFRPHERAYLAEYIQVMEPVTIALNTLQAEEKCFMGVLLPVGSNTPMKHFSQ